MSIFNGSHDCLADLCFFFFNDTATTEIYTLSLHDALPIWPWPAGGCRPARAAAWQRGVRAAVRWRFRRSEEHTSELQSRLHLVCRLLLEKKKRLNAILPMAFKAGV